MKVIGNLTKDAIIRAAVSEGQMFPAVDSTAVFLMRTGKVIFDRVTTNLCCLKRIRTVKAAVVGTVSGTISYGSVVEFNRKPLGHFEGVD